MAASYVDLYSEILLADTLSATTVLRGTPIPSTSEWAGVIDPSMLEMRVPTS